MGQITGLVEEEAWTIAEIARSLLLGYEKQASICVVNRQGQPLVQITMDNTRPFTASVALKKAQQAAWTGHRTRYLRDKVQAGELGVGLLGIDHDDFVPWAGGVPIYDIENVLLGGAGVSNLTEDEDEEYCIRAVGQAGFLSDHPS